MIDHADRVPGSLTVARDHSIAERFVGSQLMDESVGLSFIRSEFKAVDKLVTGSKLQRREVARNAGQFGDQFERFSTWEFDIACHAFQLSRRDIRSGRPEPLHQHGSLRPVNRQECGENQTACAQHNRGGPNRRRACNLRWSDQSAHGHRFAGYLLKHCLARLRRRLMFGVCERCDRRPAFFELRNFVVSIRSGTCDSQCGQQRRQAGNHECRDGQRDDSEC